MFNFIAIPFLPPPFLPPACALRQERTNDPSAFSKVFTAQKGAIPSVLSPAVLNQGLSSNSTAISDSTNGIFQEGRAKIWRLETMSAILSDLVPISELGLSGKQLQSLQFLLLGECYQDFYCFYWPALFSCSPAALQYSLWNKGTRNSQCLFDSLCVVRERENNAGEAHVSLFHLLWSQYVLSLLPELMGSWSRHRLKMSCGCRVQLFRIFAEPDSQTSLTVKPGWIFCQCNIFRIINRPVIYLKDALIS